MIYDDIVHDRRGGREQRKYQILCSFKKNVKWITLNKYIYEVSQTIERIKM